MYLWRAVDHEGEAPDLLAQERRNTAAALKLFGKRLRNQGIHPETVFVVKLSIDRAAEKMLGLIERRQTGDMRLNDRAEKSHVVIQQCERE